MNQPGVSMDNLRDVLQPALEALEIERKRMVDQTRFAAAIAFFVAAIVAVLLLGALGTMAWPFAAIAAAIVGTVIVGFVYASAMKTYRSGFKHLVMKHIVAAVDPSLSYAPESGIREDEFRMCQMFREPDRYKSEDLIEGTIGQTRVRFSEVHAEYRTSNGKGQTQYHTIFEGLLFIADFNKSFNGVTLVMPDVAQRALGGFGQSLQALGAKLSFAGRELVKLEDPEFERNFVVYGADQVESRYLLSPSMMRRLLDFRTKTGSSFHLAFLAGQIYLAIPVSENLFEPPGWNKTLDAGCIEKYIGQLQWVLGIVEDLDLNTRIWSKPPSQAAAPNAPLSSSSPNPPMQHRWA